MKTKRIEIEHLQVFLISLCGICLVLWTISPLLYKVVAPNVDKDIMNKHLNNCTSILLILVVIVGAIDTVLTYCKECSKTNYTSIVSSILYEPFDMTKYNNILICNNHIKLINNKIVQYDLVITPKDFDGEEGIYHQLKLVSYIRKRFKLTSQFDKVILLREDSKAYKEFMDKALDISETDKVVELIDSLKVKYHMSSADRQLLVGSLSVGYTGIEGVYNE